MTFTLNGRTVRPNYPQDIKLITRMETGERYYRTELDTELTFTDQYGDYSWIMSQAFDFHFLVVLNHNGTQWFGHFYKTDCKIDHNHKTVIVKPGVYDQYTNFLGGIDKEVDVVKLAPAVVSCGMTKRAIVQMYCLGGVTLNVPDKVLTNYIGGMSWEQDITADESSITPYALVNTYRFCRIASHRVYTVKFTGAYSYLTGMYHLTNPEASNYYEYASEDYKIVIYYGPMPGSEDVYCHEEFRDMQDNVIVSSVWEVAIIPERSQPPLNGFQNLESSADAIAVYGRILTGLSSHQSYTIYRLPATDIIDSNMNYQYVAAGASLFPDGTVVFSTETQVSPTEYGKNELGEYFVKPGLSVTTEYYPIARTLWSPMSVWMKSGLSDITRFNELADAYKLKDAYPIEAVVQTLLAGLYGYEPDGVTPRYRFSLAQSAFLADSQFGRTGRRLLVAPLSNVKKTWYQNPAQKGTMTLRSLLDMFRDVFHCYWWVDSDRYLHIEHVSYFMKGGTYSDTERSIGADVTAMRAPRNFLPWTFGQESYSFDKPEMPERVETEWGIAETEPFNGYPLQYSNGYVQKGRVEKVSIGGFGSDVDYITEQAAKIGDDGWVLIDATYANGDYTSPLVFLTTGPLNPQFLTQNGYMAFLYTVRQYGRWDMSAPDATMADFTVTAQGTVRARRQSITFPRVGAIPTTSLIRTSLGDGEIDTLTHNLLSASYSADLKLNTDE